MTTKVLDGALPHEGSKAGKTSYAPWRLFIAAIGIIGMIALMLFLPDDIGLSPAGKKAIAVMWLMVLWWISGVCSILTTSFLGIALLLIFKVASIKVVFSGFSDSTVVFLVFGFAIASAITKTGLGKRIAYAIMAKTRPRYGSILVTFAIISVLLAAIIPSGTARTVLMGALGMMLLPVFGQSEEKMSNVGRGIFTLLGLTGYAGSSAYLTGGAGIILTVGLLQKAGYSITYLQWLIIAFPAILIGSVALALIMPRLFKPEVSVVDEQHFKEFQSELTSLGPMSTNEKKTAIIMGIVLFLWVIGDFIKLSFIIVGVAGAVALMFPFVNAIDDNDFNKRVSWDAIYFIGVCMTLGSVLTDTKVTEFLATAINPLMASSSLTVFCLKIWLVATLVHFILPSSLPAFATCLPLTIASAQVQNYSVLIPVAVFVISYSGIAMVYQQAHAAIAYGFKQFDAADFYKPGLCLLLIWLVLTPILVFYLSLLGF
ncbi:MAG: anion permease [Deltaproteobacteria bacterium]|nr:anion permease [Deltaproteobacteria bacterium]